MNRFASIFCSLLLSCTKPIPAPESPVNAGAPATAPQTGDAARDTGASAPAPVDAGAPETSPDAGAIAPDAGAATTAQADAGSTGAAGARCSASTLSPEPKPAQPPLPPAVESMRRRIIAAAVACDYERLEALTHETGQGFTASFGDDRVNVAEYWRKSETRDGDPVLARIVKLLNLPHAKSGGLYVWPSAYGEHPKPKDWKALESVYTPEQLAQMRSVTGGGYVGFRLGIHSNGDWDFAIGGD
ncbi:MAG TPA: hypothetical protein VFZ09_49010 [Archangium sp.]|uniref:hypothetical protein n=1 Tax=Archangium sp. TaxID=1872627 RepID=UPI002E2F7A15|nr:hypothetical protein [Archangium sp.]HEX5754220.1 hypothetical protein [Archangium sp.]